MRCLRAGKKQLVHFVASPPHRASGNSEGEEGEGKWKRNKLFLSSDVYHVSYRINGRTPRKAVDGEPIEYGKRWLMDQRLTLDCFGTTFTGPNPDAIVKRQHKNLAVADFALFASSPPLDHRFNR